jgi:DNA-binding XRE family transcriptional regulator
MKQSSTRYKSAKDFGKALGLSEIDMELARQKVKLIEKLKARRLERGLSQAALAKRIGSLQPAIARMESGQVSQVSMDFLLRIALILDISVTIAKKAA